LGAAVHKDALRHQLTLLQQMGCDAIRTSHNMPDPQLVELCDEMGMMMMIEPFDVWNHGKTENDYNKEFDAWWRADITNMVKHYRNNACVMLWSSGNEVWNQVLADGIGIVTQLQDLFHALDPTRPVTNGMDQAMHVIHNGFGAAVELPGFNYRTGRYLEGYEYLPQKMILGSETASTVSSRGVYKIPAVLKDNALYDDHQSSGYDLEYCPWSGLPEQDFQLQDDYHWTLGQFVWTGFDYLGEPSPYDTDAWPSHSSYFGIIDLASLPKDRYWLYRSQWNKTDATLHVLPHWNWNKKEKVPVFCYTSYPSAELFVNGKSYGKLRFATAEETALLAKGNLSPTLSTREGEARVSAMPKVAEFEVPEWGSAPRPELLPRYRLMWFDVPYKKGKIEVVAYDAAGKEAARETVCTAGKPHHLEIIWANEQENPEELCYYTIRVVDRKGNLCPFANNLITYQGDGFVAAANGDAACLDSFVKPQMHAFAGQCTFIVRKNSNGRFKMMK
jgi:beta-galactosidase